MPSGKRSKMALGCFERCSCRSLLKRNRILRAENESLQEQLQDAEAKLEAHQQPSGKLEAHQQPSAAAEAALGRLRRCAHVRRAKETKGLKGAEAEEYIRQARLTMPNGCSCDACQQQKQLAEQQVEQVAGAHAEAQGARRACWPVLCPASAAAPAPEAKRRRRCSDSDWQSLVSLEAFLPKTSSTRARSWAENDIEVVEDVPAFVPEPWMQCHAMWEFPQDEVEQNVAKVRIRKNRSDAAAAAARLAGHEGLERDEGKIWVERRRTTSGVGTSGATFVGSVNGRKPWRCRGRSRARHSHIANLADFRVLLSKVCRYI